MDIALLGQQISTSIDWTEILRRNGPFGVAIAAIVICGIVSITKTLIRHRERMAMIEQGMHPDGEISEEDAADGA